MTKKSFELLPGDSNYTFSLMFLLVLLPTEVDTVMQKKCYKGNAVRALGSGGGKVILTLLAEIITFYVELTIIDVR